MMPSQEAFIMDSISAQAIIMGKEGNKEFKLPKRGIYLGMNKKARKALKWFYDHMEDVEVYTINPP